jgi:hypothetical protein
MRRWGALALFVGLVLVGCATKGIVTHYPLGEDTMNRLEKGTAKLGCEWIKEARLAWGIGRREATVRCPDGREAMILADSRPNREFDSTFVSCRKALEPSSAQCGEFAEALWNAGE